MATIYLIAPLPVLNCDVADVYVGSTTQKLGIRFKGHKSQYNHWIGGKGGKCASYNIFEKYGVHNCTVIQIERCPLENRKEREAYWINVHNGINYFRLNSHTEEYKIEYRNKPEIKSSHRQSCQKYYEANKDTIEQKRREYAKRPDVKKRHAEIQKMYMQRKRAEKVAKSDCTRESANSLPSEQLASCV